MSRDQKVVFYFFGLGGGAMNWDLFKKTYLVTR